MFDPYSQLPSSDEIRRMQADELGDLVFEMLQDGWEHPDPDKLIPSSRSLLLRFYEALEWPTEEIEETPMFKKPVEGVFGHTSFFIDKDPAKQRWLISAPLGGTQKRQAICQVHWRCAFDPAELQSSSNASDFLNALDACLTLSPLSIEEEAKVRKSFPNLPPHTLIPEDANKWVGTSPTVSEKEPKPAEVASATVDTVEEDELCLKRRVMLD